jgi:hypothetical protein
MGLAALPESTDGLWCLGSARHACCGKVVANDGELNDRFELHISSSENTFSQLLMPPPPSAFLVPVSSLLVMVPLQECALHSWL